MQEQLILFETAKLAKEKGFKVNNSEDFYFYNEKHYPEYPRRFEYLRVGYDDDLIAPTQSLLQKWLREKHNIIVISDLVTGFSDSTYSWNIYTKNNIWSLTGFTAKVYDSYEEALEAGLLEALKLIK